MLILLSPAKTLDFKTETPVNEHTTPDFAKKADEISKILSKHSIKELAELLDVSTKIAELNHQRYSDWKSAEERQAIYAYNGDVYEGLQAYTLDRKSIEFAQKHVRIISGLYGILKPLDLIKPYRLDMGTKLAIGKNSDLYYLWKEVLTENVLKNLKELNSNTIINLASNEYSNAINLKNKGLNVIQPTFKDNKNGVYKTISFYAKKARGLMARYIIDYKLTNPEHLQGFDSEGYLYQKNLSTDKTLIFHRG